MTPHRLAPEVLASFHEIVGHSQVITDPGVVSGYVVDWTGRFRGLTPAVLRPGSEAEVAAIIEVCRRTGTALVLQGGNTGLVGGSVPLFTEVVLSLGRLRRLDEVDVAAGQVTAGAGVTLDAVQRAATAAGWAYGVDLAARSQATVGGSIATNAGGLRVVRYGSTRSQLAGAAAVLGTGERVSHLAGLTKDNTGYDLAQLLCGSEGTLGVVTVTRLKLVAPAPCRVVALLAFARTQPALEAAVALRRHLPALSAAELFFHQGLSLVHRVTGAAQPFDRVHHSYLLVEVADATDPLAAFGEAVDSLRSVVEMAVAVEPGPAAQLWQLREAHTTAINTLGAPHKLDVTLPDEMLAEFIDTVSEVVGGASPGGRTWLFGHACDGNIHVNVTGVAPDDDRVDDAVLRLAAAMGGSITAEHGIGTAKRRWLHLNRSPAEIEAFRSIKRALDPDRILNPAVLLPD